jgi:hypothetical protein
MMARRLAGGLVVLGVATLALVGSSSARSSRTITVCPVGPPACDFRTVQGALQAAANGDRILVASGTYAGPIVIAKNVSVIGAGAQKTTINIPPQNAPALTKSPPSICGCVVRVTGGTSVTIAGLRITGGVWFPEPRGGGIWNDGDLTIENSTITGNRGTPSGGIYNTGSLLVDQSIVSRNQCNGCGAGIQNDGGFLTVRDSSVMGNNGFPYGGIANWRGITEISGSTIADNFGSGITNGGALTVERSSVLGNLAADHAGAGILNYGTATVADSSISGNIGDSGAGIYNSRGTLTVARSTVSENLTNVGYDDGGGIWNNGKARIYDTTISGNSGVVDSRHYFSAGGFDNHGDAHLTRVTITGNDAQAQGGGIRNADTGTMSIDHSTITKNTAQGLDGHGIFGGGIYNLGVLSLTQTSVSGNTPDDCVGCPSGGGQARLRGTFTLALLIAAR